MLKGSRLSFGGGGSGLFSFRGGGERRISTVGSILLLVTIGLLGLRSSSTDHALAEPLPWPLSQTLWTWSPNVKVSDEPGTAWQPQPAIAVDPGGNAYAVWTDYRNGDSDIYFSYRPFGGIWGANVKVNDDPGTASQLSPAIAVDASGNVYAVWTDGRNDNYHPDIYFSYRPAGGSWGANVKVNDDPGTAGQYGPAIAVDASGNAYAMWQDGRNVAWNPDIYFSYRPAGGIWGVNVKVNDGPGTARQNEPAITVDPAGNAYAVWADGRNDRQYLDIYFSYRPAGGSWGINVKVSDDPGVDGQYGPAIAVDASGNAYAVWQDGRNVAWNPDIYFSYRPTGGSWGTNVKVNDDPGMGGHHGPAIVVDAGGEAYAVWYDYRNGEGDGDIYFSYRPAGGTWGPNVRVNDDPGTAWQNEPAIAMDSSGKVYAVWTDRRDGPPDIYGWGDIYFAYWPAMKWRMYVPLFMKNY